MTTLVDTVHQLLKTIKTKTKELNEREELIKTKEDSYRKYTAQLEKLKTTMNGKKITFNVSGKKFMFTVDQLTYYPDSFFTKLVTWRLKKAKDADDDTELTNEIYIDRDPIMFAHIAQMMYRPDVIYAGDDIEYLGFNEHKYFGLKHECEYFGMPFNLRHKFDNILIGKISEACEKIKIDVELEQGCLVVIHNKVYWLPVSDNIAKILKKIYGNTRHVENIISINNKLNIVGVLDTVDDSNNLMTLLINHKHISYSDDNKDTITLLEQQLKNKKIVINSYFGVKYAKVKLCEKFFTHWFEFDRKTHLLIIWAKINGKMKGIETAPGDYDPELYKDYFSDDTDEEIDEAEEDVDESVIETDNEADEDESY